MLQEVSNEESRQPLPGVLLMDYNQLLPNNNGKQQCFYCCWIHKEHR